MFFVLSKTLNYLVMPLTIVFLCLLVAALLRNQKWKRRLFLSGFILLFVFSNDFIANELMRAWEIETIPYKDMRRYEIAIVLTGATIPLLEPGDRVYFQRGADRVTHAVQLYKLGLISKVLVSGGSGQLVDIGEREADKFRDAMVMMGIPDEKVVLENKTRNTRESAVAVKKMLDSMNIRAEDCLLITSSFHMRRSLACYRKVGLELQPFTTDFYGHRRVFSLDSLILPKVDALVIWHKLLREWTGFVAYKLAGYI